MKETTALEEMLQARHDARLAFVQLSLLERIVVALVQRYAVPPGYTGPWPPTPRQIGGYLQQRFPHLRGQLSQTRAVGKIHRRALAKLRSWLEARGVDHAS